MEVSDAALVRRALAGDRAAFGDLSERHRPLALRLARRMLGDALDAEDVTQEACLQAYLSLRQLRDPARFGPWLCGIALNLSRMRLRTRRATYSLEDWDGGRVALGFAWAEAQPSPEAAYEVRELHALVLRAVALLPPEQRAVVRLYYLDGLSLAEIGVLAGRPVGTVKARLHRARARLRAALSSSGEQARRQKERLSMIEVVVQDVITRVGRPQDVIEAASKDPTPPEAKEVRRPLPPGLPHGVLFLKGDSESARAVPESDAMDVHRIVLLQEKSGERLLPIWIGPHEGNMLALQLHERSAPRPLTYDLMVRMLELAQATVERVVVNRLHDKVFYAVLQVRAGNESHALDARPSDALNLALRVGAPIFVAPEVMESESVQPEGLQAKLAADHEGVTFTWASTPPPEFNLPRPAPSEKPE